MAIIKKHTQNKNTNDEIICRYCSELAVCNNYQCYKIKNNEKIDCESCKERFCSKHWKRHFRRAF